MRDLFNNDPQPNGWKPKLSRFFLDLDSRIDSGLYHARRWGRELYERFTVFMDRFHVSGWRRWYLVEPISEGLTLGAGGLVLMLALAIPAFRETSDEDWLKASQLAVTFLDRYGNEIGSRGIRHNDSIPLDEFPDHLIKAVLATEDRRFYEHFGIDIAGTFRAMLTNARAGGVVQGGSSITQQLAKNLFLSNERTIERKVKEAFLAHLAGGAAVEERHPQALSRPRLSRRRHLRRRRRRAVLFQQVGARREPRRSPRCSPGLFKAPSKFAPHINLPAARARANVVLDNLVEAGFMTEGQVFGARRNPVDGGRPPRRARAQLLSRLGVRRDEEARRDAAADGARSACSSRGSPIDVNLQRQAELAVENSLRQHGREYHARQAAAVLMEHDGAVRAMVGGRDYGESQFNRATDALRQPGSSFKPYVYAAALQSGGFKPTSVVVDSPVCIGNWCPKNYSGGYSGSMTLTAGADALDQRRAGQAVDRARQRQSEGRPRQDPRRRPQGGAALAAHRHAVDADRRQRSDGARPHRRLRHLRQRRQVDHAARAARSAHRHGDLVWRFDRDGKKPVQVIDPQVALDMNMMLNSAAEQGTGRRAMLPGIPIAGKTGTTNAYRDAWFVGYTGNYIAGVWFGNDDYQATNRMTGGSLPAMTWQEIMVYAHQGIELRPLPGRRARPSPALPGGRRWSRRGPVDPDGRQFVLTRRGADILVAARADHGRRHPRARRPRRAGRPRRRPICRRLAAGHGRLRQRPPACRRGPR